MARNMASPTLSEPVVYKICPRADWLRALQLGQLEPSADDARDGYIHLSRRSQLPGTLARHFAGRGDLVLLALRAERVAEGALRYERSRGGELFPHLYGLLPVASVERVFELAIAANGEHVLPEAL